MSDLDQDQEALGIIHAATVHLRNQFRMDWPRELAAANLEARSILFKSANMILAEYHMAISKEEMQGVLIIEKEQSRANPRPSRETGV